MMSESALGKRTPNIYTAPPKLAAVLHSVLREKSVDWTSRPISNLKIRSLSVVRCTFANRFNIPTYLADRGKMVVHLTSLRHLVLARNETLVYRTSKVSMNALAERVGALCLRPTFRLQERFLIACGQLPFLTPDSQSKSLGVYRLLEIDWITGVSAGRLEALSKYLNVHGPPVPPTFLVQALLVHIMLRLARSPTRL